ncbi:DUF6694 family lipoprotein [Pseudoalteromonas sp. AS84]|uniref:DUF6694 family lipoprotein n=1 Tax=Pseudoalteromonas sp. AS84 TaxID=3135778 RepID=UPI00317A3B0C
MKHWSLLLVGMSLLVGCGEKKVDSTTDESLKTSITSIKESLTEEKKVEFEKAVKVLAFSDVGNIFKAAANADGIKSKMKEKLNGKTADQIISESNDIIAARKIKEREQATKEIEEIKTDILALEKKKSDAQNAKESLNKFSVIRSRFYYQKASYRDEAVIELTVKNNTKHAISRAYFDGVLVSQGRSVPWVSESFNYSIAGGLEPDEEVTWKLTPNRFGAWGKAPKDRDDMVLTVSVRRIDGADEKAIFDYSISKYDEKKLTKLNKRLEKLNALLKS